MERARASQAERAFKNPKKWRKTVAAGTLTAAAMGLFGTGCSEDGISAEHVDKGNMQLVFSDEFTGQSLDEKKWNPCYPWWDGNGCTNENNKEWQWYQPSNISIKDGILHLTGEKESVKPQGNPYTYEYTSGMIASKEHWQYGYTEVRAKVPEGKGLWPALWQLPQDGEWPPEIDIVEVLGDKSDVALFSNHWGKADDPKKDVDTYVGQDFSQDFHTYGLNWQKDAITWFVDGVPVKKYTNTNNIPHKPMYFLANLAIGGTLPGDVDESTSFPTDFQIDYVRVYKDKKENK